MIQKCLMKIMLMQKCMVRTKYKNLGDYHDICVKTGVLLLTEVFENFRLLC